MRAKKERLCFAVCDYRPRVSSNFKMGKPPARPLVIARRFFDANFGKPAMARIMQLIENRLKGKK